MPYIRRNNAGNIHSYAAIAPPTAEAELWEVATDDDPQVQAFLNPVVSNPPDWNGFFTRLEASDIAMHIMSSRSPVLMWLAVEFGKRSTDSIDAQRLLNYWNQTMLGLSSRLSSEQIERLNSWAIEFRLPVRALANSNLTLV